MMMTKITYVFFPFSECIFSHVKNNFFPAIFPDFLMFFVVQKYRKSLIRKDYEFCNFTFFKDERKLFQSVITQLLPVL